MKVRILQCAAAVGLMLCTAAVAVFQSTMRLDGYPYPVTSTITVTGETAEDGNVLIPRPPPLTIRGVPDTTDPIYDGGDGGGDGPAPSYPTNVVIGYMMTGDGTAGETDIGPYGYDLTTTNTIDLVETDLPYVGFAGKSRRFDSENNEFLVGTNAFTELQALRSNFTIAVWFKADDVFPASTVVAGRWLETGNKRVYYNGTRSTRNPWTEYSANGIAETGLQGVPTPPTTATNRWIHIAANYYEDDSQALYWNGDFNATNVTMAYFPVTDTDTPFSIGATADGLLPWNGVVAEPVIFTPALTPDEILRLVNDGVSTMGTNTMVAADYRKMAAGYLMNNDTVVEDLTGHGQAAYAGATISGAGPTLVTNVPPGFSGYSLDFEADDGDYLIVSNDMVSAEIQNLMYEGTVMAWVNIESYPSTVNHIIAKASTTGDMLSWALAVNDTSGRLVWRASNNGTAWTGEPVEFAAKTLGVWTHVAYTFTRTYAVPSAAVNYTTVHLYVNGVDSRTYSPNNTAPLLRSTAPMLIGAMGSAAAPTEFFDGMLDEVAVYNYAMTPTEINAAMTNGIDAATGSAD